MLEVEISEHLSCPPGIISGRAQAVHCSFDSCPRCFVRSNFFVASGKVSFDSRIRVLRYEQTAWNITEGSGFQHPNDLMPDERQPRCQKERVGTTYIVDVHIN